MKWIQRVFRKLRYILILFSHLNLCLPADLFPSGFLTAVLFELLSPMHQNEPELSRVFWFKKKGHTELTCILESVCRVKENFSSCLLTFRFLKPADAELTYFLGVEIQSDERRFASHISAGLLATCQPTSFFFGYDIFILFHILSLLTLQLTHKVCHLFLSPFLSLSYSWPFVSRFLFLS